jgi:hypothetical protein
MLKRCEALVEAGHPRSGDGNLLRLAQPAGSSDSMAAYDLNRDKLI